MFTNEEIVEKTANLLKEHPEWRECYLRYADDIQKIMDDKLAFGKLFQTRNSLHVYSTTTQSGTEFQIRFAGKKVGIVKYDTRCKAQSEYDKVFLTVKDEHLKVAKALDNDYNGMTFDKEPWRGEKASNYRSFFNQKKSTNKTCAIFTSAGLDAGKEARLENKLLVEFKTGHLIRNITPIRLCGGFFQFATPISACDHKIPPKYSGSKGGGIDILARVNHGSNHYDNRLAVLELKDSDENDTQADALTQAIAYATFLAYLLKDNGCGNKWWNIFGKNKEVPPELHIDAVSLMPEGCNSEKGDMTKSLVVPGIPNVIIHPYALYFKQDSDGNPVGFSGNLKEEIDK